MGAWVAPTQICIQPLGQAQATLDAAVELVQSKAHSYTTRAQADSERTQEALARASAHLRAARAFLYETAEGMWDEMQHGKLSRETGLVAQLAASFVCEASVTAVDLVHSVLGTTGIRQEQPFERIFRDIHTYQQNAFISKDRYESVGKVMLGRETNWVWFNV